MAGPGSTNLVNAVASAWLDRVPMIAISGQIEGRREPTFTHQVIDHGTLFKPISKWATAVQPNTVATIMRRALRSAMAERPGPVHLTTAADVVGATATDADIVLPPLTAQRAPQWFAAAGVEADPVRRLRAARRKVYRYPTPDAVVDFVREAAPALAGELPSGLRAWHSMQCAIVAR